ncbi:hypothetical protein [Pontimicrobium sp. IMCC45349]|uniref:hypothetical protein n=1 Tax=Pontimicrobium sp. IMCC45349 TaxID=3391574 RepID=UPI00399F5194
MSAQIITTKPIPKTIEFTGLTGFSLSNLKRRNKDIITYTDMNISDANGFNLNFIFYILKLNIGCLHTKPNIN